MAILIPQFVWVVPWERFVYRLGNTWHYEAPVSRDGIKQFLLALPESALPAVTAELKAQTFTRVFGVEREPNAGLIFQRDGLQYLNSWVAPTLRAVPGGAPTFEKLLDYLTANDDAGKTWLKHWLAAKLQEPARIPKIAVVFSSSQGAGKNFLCRFIQEALGVPNTALITHAALRSEYNHKYIDKLFVIADEVVDNDHKVNSANKLKSLIDAEDVEYHAKFVNQRSMRSRMAWIINSNDVSPLMIEPSDRRYTVFANHEPVPEGHRRMLDDCFEKDGVTFSAPFVREMQAFLHELLNLEVDYRLIRRPYDNEARKDVISASTPSAQAFIEHVNEHGIDPTLEQVIDAGLFNLTKTRAEWDWGAGGLATDMIYRCYVHFAKAAGQYPLAIQRFGIVAKKHWTRVKPTTPAGRQVYGYLVPRSPKKPDQSFKPTEGKA